MRRSLIPMLAAVLTFACADAPTTPLLTAMDPSFERAPIPDYPPPPFAIISGDVSTEYGDFNFVAHFFANKPGNIAWLQFKSTTTAGVTFSSNARIMSVNGDVSGVGTVSIGGNTIQLSEIDTFAYQSYRFTNTVSFSGGSVRSGFAVGPKGGGGEVCTIDTECFISKR